MAFWDDIKKYAPYLLGADLATKGIGISSEKSASSDALRDYLGAHKDATEWTPEDRASMMKAISGIYSEQAGAMKRKASTSLADKGIGGGTYGKRAEQIERQSREASARSLAGTFGPSGKPPSAEAFFKNAQAQARNPLSETMNDALSMLGEFGVIDAMGGGKTIKSAGKGLQSLLGIGSGSIPAAGGVGPTATAAGGEAFEAFSNVPMANPELGAGWSDWTNVASEGGSELPFGLFPTDGGFTGFLPGMGLTWGAGALAKKALFPDAGQPKAPNAEGWLNAYSEGLDTVPGWPDSKLADNENMSLNAHMLYLLRKQAGQPTNKNMLNPTPTALEQQFMNRDIGLNEFMAQAKATGQYTYAPADGAH